jgi:glucokinase-like ROK family protein
VLNVLRQEHSISRADIARMTGLTPATVSSLVTRLQSSSIVRITGFGESRGGRRPRLVEFFPDAFYLAGVDIGIEKAIALVTDLHGRIRSRARITLVPSEGREKTLRNVMSMTRSVLEQLGSGRKKVRGIGVSFPGLIDADRGIALQLPALPGWRETPLVAAFRDEFGLPCCLENDAKAMALGEAWLGAGRGCKNIFATIIGRGIGGGIVLNGELYRGQYSTSGEIGHVTINPDGPRCSCGNRGCLEAMASGKALAAAAIRAARKGGAARIVREAKGNIEHITAENVAAAARDGDALALRLVNESARYIGIGLAAVVNLLSPEMIIIGGGLSRMGDFYLRTIKETIAARAFAHGLTMPRIALSTLGENASCLGAAALVLKEALSA